MSVYCVPHVCLVLEEDGESSRTGDMDDCEGPCRFWEMNSGSIRSQMFLTSEQSLQSQVLSFLIPGLISINFPQNSAFIGGVGREEEGETVVGI